MNKVLCWIFAATAFLGASCARELPSDRDRVALRLQFSEPTASKVDLLAAGDAAGVFARTEGQGTYALENHRFVSDASGMLVGDPATYFSDARQATHLLVYLPYAAGQTDPSAVAFTTPVDQTANDQVRGADLLWGRTASTPVADAVPVPLEHLLAKVTVDVGGVVERWSVHNILIDGSLNAENGVFVPGATQAHVSTTGRSELILIPQSVQTLDCTVDGVDYTFEASTPIVLAAGKSYTLDLTLHPANHTASLAEPIGVTDWTVADSQATVNGTANNQCTVFWKFPSFGYTEVDRVVVEASSLADPTTKSMIEVTNLALAPGHHALMAQFSFDFASSDLSSPYTIHSLSFYHQTQLVDRVSSLLGAGVYKQGAYTLGIEGMMLVVSTPGTFTSWDELMASGTFGAYNSFSIQLVDPQFDCSLVSAVRLYIGGVVYPFANVSTQSVTQSGLATLSDIAFPATGNLRPARYPYSVGRIEVLDRQGGVLQSAACDFSVTYPGGWLLQMVGGGVTAIRSSVGPWDEGSASGSFPSGGVLNVFRVQLLAPQYDVRRTAQLRLTDERGTIYWFGNVTATAPSNSVLTTLSDAQFPATNGTQPTGYPFRIRKIEVLDSRGVVLQGAGCDFQVSSSGVILLQLSQGGSVQTGGQLHVWADRSVSWILPSGGVSNSFRVCALEPTWDYGSTRAIRLTIGGDSYTFSGVLVLNSSTRLAVDFSTVGFTTRVPMAYPFVVSRVEFLNASGGVLYDFSGSVSVSASGVVGLTVY